MITFEGQEIITGTRNPGTDGLWTTVLPTQSKPQAFPPAIHNQAMPANLVAFAHAALFSPALSTLDMALSKGFLPPFMGLSHQTLHKYPPHSEATIMGYLDNKHKNIQSTKAKATADDIEYEFPVQPADTTRTNQCYLSASEPKHLVYTDQTGQLPSTSNEGNKYLLVAYDYDSNCILLRPIRNRHADTLTKAIADIHTILSRGG
jgi:hypothetical protein